MVCGYVVSRLTLNVFGLAVSTFQQFLGLENGGVFVVNSWVFNPSFTGVSVSETWDGLHRCFLLCEEEKEKIEGAVFATK